MSREIRELIAQLELEREAIVDFVDLLQEQVRTNEINESLAQEILNREFHGHHYTELIALKNKEIREAQEILRAERARPQSNAVPAAIVLLIGVALVMNFGAITGLFTLSDETFYSHQLNQDYASDTVIVLPFTQNISSLRVDGAINGTGKAHIWLLAGNSRYLVADFTPKSSSSALTGFVIAGNDTNATEQPMDSVPLLDDHQADLPVENDTNTTSPQIEPPETSIPAQETPPEQASPQPIELEATPPQQEQTEQQPERTELLDHECLETCSLTGIASPYQLRIDITGDVNVHLDQLIYGELPAQIEQPQEEPAQLPAEERKALGATCAIDSECASGTCTQNMYQGTPSEKICTQTLACVAGNTAYVTGTTLGDSTCRGGSRSIWIANQGTGRLEIKTSTGSYAAVIDKYGNMAVAGQAHFNALPATDGWVVKDTAGTAKLSISEAGVLQAASTLSERTTPQPTAGGDFIVRNSNQELKAIFTEGGAVVLAGDFASEVDLR